MLAQAGDCRNRQGEGSAAVPSLTSAMRAEREKRPQAERVTQGTANSIRTAVDLLVIGMMSISSAHAGTHHKLEQRVAALRQSERDFGRRGFGHVCQSLWRGDDRRVCRFAPLHFATADVPARKAAAGPLSSGKRDMRLQ